MHDSSSLHFHLSDHDATMSLGACLATVMRELDRYPAILLDGELGAGKTTFVRGLVLALPGGDQAEVASPSFNYMNTYPTNPETLHFDFYRLCDMGPDDELINALHEPAHLVIVEWAAYCHPRHLPADRLTMHFTAAAPGRNLTVRPHGDYAALVVRRLGTALSSNFQSREAM